MKLGTEAVRGLARVTLAAGFFTLLFAAQAAAQNPAAGAATPSGSAASSLTATGAPAKAAPAEAAAGTKAGATSGFEAARSATGAVPGGTAGTAVATGKGTGVFPENEKLTYGFGSWPPDLSTHGKKIQDLYDLIFLITGITFVVTEGLLLWFAWKYRARPGHKAIYSHGNNALEIGWTLLPVVIFVTLGVSSADQWAQLKDRSKFPADAFTVKVTGRQFEWVIQYPGADGKFGTEDDYETINDLHVPYGKPVRVELSSFDVIHSFFLPELRVKQDALPGMQTEVWFQATRPAETEIACAELCGLGHYRMKGKLTIQAMEQVQAWLKNEKENE